MDGSMNEEVSRLTDNKQRDRQRDSENMSIEDSQ